MFLAEKFAVRIAEGGNDANHGGGPGGAEAPPGPSEKIGKYLARKVLKYTIKSAVPSVAKINEKTG